MANPQVAPLMPVTFNYTPIADLTTCQPYTFQWTYTTSNMSVNNTLFSYIQYGDFKSIPGLDAYLFASVPLATQSSWTWPQVNVAAGQYALISWIEGNSTIKPSPQSFTVTNGSDTSCVVTPAEAAVQATPSSTSGTNSATGSSSTSSHHISTGAIVGIALGILSGVALIILLSRLLKKRKQTSTGRAAAFVARQQSLRHASRESAVGLVGLRGSNADWFTPPFAHDKGGGGDGSSQYSRDSAFMNYGYEKDVKPAGTDAFSLPYGAAPPTLPYGAAPPTLPYGATPSVPPRAMSRVPVQYGDGESRRESEEGGERQSRTSAHYPTSDVPAPQRD
ncbi:hypothetical protein BD410DRAFT_785890 [Rickenella mellea]|uniref:Uncharacterized protein n=1 Tax=Rickenella mellea TaxID=50990 RepID=A0A4Y7QAF3_9AGAM|nr:hypothetical protein BD410DRAFT_785890 [Rickenella mellea]